MKKVILVSFFYPPSNQVAALRASKWARSLALSGFDVTVFTADYKKIADSYKFAVEADIGEVGSGAGKISVQPVPFYLHLLNGYYSSPLGRSSFLRAIRYIIRRYVLGDSDIGWSLGLLSCVRTYVEKHGRPDLMVYSAGPFFPLAVLPYLSSKYAFPYWLDFRDLWSKNSVLKLRFPARFLAEKIEKKAIKKAASVFSVSKAVVSVLRNEVQSGAEFHTIYNFPDDSYYAYLEHVVSNLDCPDSDAMRNIFSLVYAGGFYPDRCTFRTVISRIYALKSLNGRKVVLNYYGAHGAAVKADLAVNGLEGCLVDHGVCEKAEVLAAMWKADVLINLIHSAKDSPSDEVKGIIATKIFEYVFLNKPILNIAPDDNELVSILNALGSDKVFSAHSDAYEKIDFFLDKILHGEFSNPGSFNRQLRWESSFSEVLKSLAPQS